MTKQKLCSACGKPCNEDNMMVGGWAGYLHPNCRKVSLNVIHGYQKWLLFHFIQSPEIRTAFMRMAKKNKSIRK